VISGSADLASTPLQPAARILILFHRPTHREQRAGNAREVDSSVQSIKERIEMAENVQEFFSGLAARADAEKTAGMNNSYLFDIEGAGEWVVKVEDGKVEVTEGGGEADTTITTSEETMMAVINGEQNPTTAYMTGKLKIKGDMGAAMKLQKLF